MDKPKISIVIPCYNSAATIERAVSSVLAQTRADWELIAIDDASQDHSLSLLENLASKDPRISTHSLSENSGAGAARNYGLENARGRYVAFLDADDEWLPSKLEKQVGWMEDQNLAFTCTAYERLKDGRSIKTIEVPETASRAQLLKNNTIGTLTAIFDRAQIDDLRFMTIRRRQDYAFWLNLLERTEYVHGLNEPLARYHTGHASLSSNKLRAARDQWRFYSEALEMGFTQKLWYFGHYAVNATKRNF